MSIEEKTNLLLNIIDQLSKRTGTEPNNFSEVIKILQKVYCDDYRHSYSDIFNKLQLIFKQDLEVGVILGENLNALKQAIEAKSKEEAGRSETRGDEPATSITNELVQGFRKFSDHINLEISRNNYYKDLYFESRKADVDPKRPASADQNIITQFDKLKDQFSDAQKEVNRIPVFIAETDGKLERVEAKFENSKVSSLTTLSIFSAVVLAFSGGITFEAGVFQGISQGSAYRLVFIVALTGFILFNTIFALLYLVSRLSSKSVESTCKHSCSESNGRICGSEFCNKPYSTVTLLCKIRHKFTYVFIIDSIFIITIYEDYILWLLRDNLWTWQKLALVSTPLLIIAFYFISLMIIRLTQNTRARIMYRNELVSAYFSGTSFLEALAESVRTLSSIMLQQSRDEFIKEHDNVSAIIRAEKQKKNPWFCRLRQSINLFVRENFDQSPHHPDVISLTTHQKNIRIWRKIKSELKKDIKKKSQ